MSINLNHFIIHGLKHNSQDQFVCVFQEEELPQSDAANQLIEELHIRFNAKPSKGIGRFAEQSESQFVEQLAQWQEYPESYVGFSQQTIRAIGEKMHEYGLANDCYVLMAEYQYVAQRFLLIAELPIKEKVTCSDSLELSRLRFLDADAMQLAVRLDLMALESNDESNYAVFIKGRAGRKVADFFLDSLAIEEAVDRKAQAEELAQVVNDYCSQHVEQKDVQAELKKEVVSFCKEQQVAGEQVNVGELSHAISGPAEVSFSDFISGSESQLPDAIEPEIKTLQRMTRFSGTGKGVSISFDAALMGGRVRYDATYDRLTIDEIPPNLKEQILKQLQSD
ncbi:nucleoid-associated protein [Echinimonas agarilytica]|uniref:Nucleoid-associated protein n=1 Tax=Echinimonas agarilytica TaxID=1215918 RepID=A0AA42B7Y5_9GAMM|nr:nucleoid-associated protein [Echinimonas agarilytica]MCM2679838.1 nucleoid-associated protein [Echinimonas agarilytica]